jgi:hypothetical protein
MLRPEGLELPVGNRAGGDFEGGSFNRVRRALPGRALRRTHREFTGGNRHKLGNRGLLTAKRKDEEG